MKKAALLITLTICLLLCTACKKDAPPEQNFSAFDASVIDWQDGELCAVAFLGYAGTLHDADMYPVYDAFEAQYPGLTAENNCTWFQTVGQEVYLIIPRYSDTLLTVTIFSEDGEESKFLQAAPLFLQCNESDIMGNSRITLEHQGTTCSFSPRISLDDSRLLLPEDGTVRDITNRALIGLSDENAEANRDLLPGDWQLYGEDEIFGFVVNYLSFAGDGTVTLAHGVADGDIIEEYQGFYTLSGEDHKELPVGTLLLTLDMVYAVYDEEISETAKGLTIESAHKIFFPDDNHLVLTNIRGDELIFEIGENVKSNRFERIEAVG